MLCGALLIQIVAIMNAFPRFRRVIICGALFLELFAIEKSETLVMTAMFFTVTLNIVSEVCFHHLKIDEVAMTMQPKSGTVLYLCTCVPGVRYACP